MRKQPKATLSFTSYFTKAHKLRAATIISGILAFAEGHHLESTGDEMPNDKIFTARTGNHHDSQFTNCWLSDHTPTRSLQQFPGKSKQRSHLD